VPKRVIRTNERSEALAVKKGAALSVPGAGPSRSSDAPPPKMVYLANSFRIYSHTRSMVNGEPRDRPKGVSDPPGLGEAGRV
jgi:hypothetical protein